MQKKKAISLIVLVITIIVMIILAGAIILSLNNSGIIDKASRAVDVTNIGTVKEIAEAAWGVAYAEGIRDVEDKEVDGVIVKGLQSRVEEELLANKIDITKYPITATTKGVTVETASYEYYSTLTAAINDVNNNTIGTNADATKTEAVAGIYVNNGKTYVVMLKDTTEQTQIQTSVDMTLNLGGHTLATNDAIAICVNSGHLTIDGRLSNSKIEASNTSVATTTVKTEEDSNLTVNGGTYIANSNGYSSRGFDIGGTANIYDAVINTNETTRGTLSVQVLATANVTISNCDITSTTSNGNMRYTYGVYNIGTVTISNSDIISISPESHACGIHNTLSGIVKISDSSVKAYSKFEAQGGQYTKSSIGVNNVGTFTFNNCYVMGTHSGVQNTGTIDINGGTYEGFNHGGIYFSGEGTTSYVSNAIIRACGMPDGYTTATEENNIGFYIGSKSNVTAYLDNCEITGTNSAFALRGSGGEQNNTIYISNSNIYGGRIRIDNDTLKLYIGRGNNFTKDNTSLPSAVVETDEVYTK